MRAILIAILFLSTFIAKAQESVYYDGAIGSYPIILELNTSDEGTAGAYFYKSRKKDINFEKVASTHGLTLTTRGPRGEKISAEEETFELVQQADGSLTGSWTSPKGLKLAVSLRPLDPKTIKHPYAHYKDIRDQLKSDPLEYLRTATIQVIKDSVVKKGSLALQYVHADHSPVYIPTIVGGIPSNIAERLNKILLERLVVGASNSYNCGIDYHLQNIYLYKNVLSLDFTEDGYCIGAAHPNENEYGITLDLQTGKELRLEDLLHFPGLPPTPQFGSDNWMTYRTEHYAPRLRKLLTQLYPTQMREKGNCGYSEEYVWEFAEWYLSPKGLRLLPSFPHAVALCNAPEWSVIPYKIVKKYIDPAANIELPAQ